MSTAQHKTLVRRIFEEGFNQNQPAVFDELIAPDYVNHSLPAPAPGAAGFAMVASMFRAAFPDLHFTIEDLIAEGDKVMTRWTMRGTHLGEFMGLPPTGKHVTAGGMQIERVVNGQIVEHWRKSDDLGLLQQLGAIPSPQAA